MLSLECLQNKKHTAPGSKRITRPQNDWGPHTTPGSKRITRPQNDWGPLPPSVYLYR